VAVKPFVPVQVTADECGDSFEKMLRRFVRRSKDEGTMLEVRRRKSYMKPSEARRQRKSHLGKKI